MNETITFASGHKVVPNGAGDYNLECPTHGIAPYMVPYMIARTLTADRVCPGCKQPIGDEVSRA